MSVRQINVLSGEETAAEYTQTELASHVPDDPQVEVSRKAKEALNVLDRRSIRGIREFLIKKFGADPDFPILLKTREQEAIQERLKLK